MTTKFLALISVIGLASICLVQAQLLVPGGTPDASPSPTKHRAHKKAEATPSPAEETASPSPAESPAEATASPTEEAASPSTAESPPASPSPGKRRAQKKAEATEAASPAAEESTAAASPSPAEKGSRKKAKTEVASSPAPAPSASPGKFSLGNLFKPKTSASAGAAAASPAPAKPAVTGPATNAPAQGGGHGLVWVNTELHVYHREGSRFYGTSKKGKYMTEQEAINEGDKAAGKGR
jgi:hypothetical protein